MNNRGAIRTLGLGAGLLLVGLIVVLAGTSSMLTMFIGFALMLAGVMVCSYSVKLFKAPDFKDPGDYEAGLVIDSPERLARLDTMERPFFVCARCKVAFAPGECHGICLRCDTVTECFEVSDDEDLKVARSALDPSTAQGS